MVLFRGIVPLSYRRLGRAELAAVGALELDVEQVERFLGPLPDILDAVRRGLAHSMIGIEAAGELVGFYVVHPDARDRSCWWLGWFAIDRRRQGGGLGRTAMAAIMGRLRGVDGCRRVRLLVAPENARALALYGRAGFRPVGVSRVTGELVLECGAVQVAPGGAVAPPVVADVMLQARRRAAWSTKLRFAARVHCAVHGPPAVALAA